MNFLIKTDQQHITVWSFLLIFFSLALFPSVSAQDSYLPSNEGAIHEIQIDYWQANKPQKKRSIKLRKGEIIKVKTWDQGVVKGPIEFLKKDSILISGAMIGLTEIEKIMGVASGKSGAGAIGLGSGVFALGLASIFIVGDSDAELDTVLLTVLIAVPAMIYGVGLVTAGLIEAGMNRGLAISGFRKEVHYHTHDEMLSNMSKRELKRYMKKQQ